MHVVQILLPTHDNNREPLPREEYVRVREELTEKFRGLTVYTRAPAEGLWRSSDTYTSRDDIMIFEVMVNELDPGWWRDFRHDLERRFRQDVIVIRAQATQLL